MVTTENDDLQQLISQGYVFGYSSVDLYRILHDHALDPDAPAFKAPVGVFAHDRELATAADRTVVALNVDTLYSSAWIDLRSGPTVLVVPPFGENRYVSAELFDLSTFIIGYVTPHTHGRHGGRYLLVGPGWSGDTPQEIDEVFQSPTELMLVFVRTQLLDTADIDAVHDLQDRYALEPTTPAASPAPMPRCLSRSTCALRRRPASSMPSAGCCRSCRHWTNNANSGISSPPPESVRVIGPRR
jgi:hypothetical protein